MSSETRFVRLEKNKLKAKLGDALITSSSVAAADSIVVPEATIEETLDKYAEALGSGKKVEVKFDSFRGDAYHANVNGVDVVLPMDDAHLGLSSKTDNITKMLSGATHSLPVSSVDREKRVVVLGGSFSKEQRAAFLRKQLHRDLGNIVENHLKTTVIGRVKRVYEEYALIDILDSGVVGRVARGNWSDFYVPTMRGVCKEGEYYEFYVIGTMSKKEGYATAYRLSRRELAAGENPWAKIDPNLYKEGDAITVKCVQRYDDKTYWIGTCEAYFPGIMIRGDYTQRMRPGMHVVEGFSYICKIKKLVVDLNNKKNCRFLVVPFDIVEEDRPKLAKYLAARHGVKPEEKKEKTGEGLAKYFPSWQNESPSEEAKDGAGTEE